MLRPANEADLAAAVCGASGGLCVRGGGTRGLAVPGDVIDVTGLSGIKLYEPGALTMVAGAGTPLAEITAALESEGQMLPFEPFELDGVTNSLGKSTIGGVFATNASGSRRIQVGAARDFLLGVRFVDGAGNVVKNGGRVMKNVTGYDLVKLLSGSFGTLGILTEVSFKVLPKPDSTTTLTLVGLDDRQAVQAMAAALGSPFDVSGAAHAPRQGSAEAETYVRIEGFTGSVAYRSENLTELLAPFGGVGVDGIARNWSDGGWPDIGANGSLWLVSVKPSDGPALVEQLGRADSFRHKYDWGGGRIWVACDADTDVPRLHANLQSAAAEIGGHATLMHSPMANELSRFQPQPVALADISRALRKKFDPRGVLNPGLMK